MAEPETRTEPRAPLSRVRVLRAGVELADDGGIDSLSMRKLGQALGVEAMSLYNHVANKDDLLDGMVDLVWSEIALPAAAGEWRAAARGIAMSAHAVLRSHAWACGLVMTRTSILPARLAYMEAILGTFREAGFPPGLTFHAYHALDSHVIGFTLWEVGHSLPSDDLADLAAGFLREVAGDHPYLAEHIEQHVAGYGSDGEGEFAFVLDLLLDGLERARAG